MTTVLEKHGITLTALEIMGSRVQGLNLREQVPAEVQERLQQEMAHRGFIVVADQGVLTGDEQVRASELWGGRVMHSTHGVHAMAPNKHIL